MLGTAICVGCGSGPLIRLIEPANSTLRKCSLGFSDLTTVVVPDASAIVNIDIELSMCLPDCAGVPQGEH